MNFERNIDPKEALQIGRKYKAIHIVKMEEYVFLEKTLISGQIFREIPNNLIHKTLQDIQAGIYSKDPFNLRYYCLHLSYPKLSFIYRSDILGNVMPGDVVFQDVLYILPDLFPEIQNTYCYYRGFLK